MPPIPKRQSPPETQRPIANDNQPVTLSGIKLNVYGQGKTGKTRFAATFPKPLLIIGSEDGTKSISIARQERTNLKLDRGIRVWQLLKKGQTFGVDFIRLVDSNWFETILPFAVSEGYKSIVLDHASGLQDIILREVIGLADVPQSRTWGLTDQKTWGTVNTQTIDRLYDLLRLAETHDKNIVIIAHEAELKNIDDADSDIMTPKINVALTPQVRNWINGAVDNICQCYIKQNKTVTNVESNGKIMQLVKPLGKPEYRLRVGTHAICKTGFRLPEDCELPDDVSPTYDDIYKIITGQYKSNQQS